jgi:peroxiredoxin
MCHGRRRWLGIISMVSMLAIGILSCVSPAQIPEVGVPAPDFTLPTTVGSEVTLSQFRGVPVVLYLWTTWCQYCIEELGYLALVVEEKGSQLTVVAVNIGGEATEVKQVAGEGGANFIIAIDEGGKLLSAYGMRYLPAAFFIDSQGIIRGKRVGAFYSRQTLLTELDSFLAR